MTTKAYVDANALPPLQTSATVAIMKVSNPEPSIVPIGTISYIPMLDSRLDLPAPYKGYVKCEGQEISGTEYPELYKAIRGTYGTHSQHGTNLNPHTNPHIRSYSGTDGGSMVIGLGPATVRIPDLRNSFNVVSNHGTNVVSNHGTNVVSNHGTNSHGNHSHVINSHTHAIGTFGLDTSITS